MNYLGFCADGNSFPAAFGQAFRHGIIPDAFLCGSPHPFPLFPCHEQGYVA